MNFTGTSTGDISNPRNGLAASVAGRNVRNKEAKKQWIKPGSDRAQIADRLLKALS